jgi:hypothetical protein
LAAEMMLIKIIRRAKELIATGYKVDAATPELNFFLSAEYTSAPESPVQRPAINTSIEKHLDIFCRLDDHDVLATIKNWCHHPDKILSVLCRSLVERKLLKIKLQANPFDESLIKQKRKEVCDKLRISEENSGYFVFTGQASNTTYDPKDERITILFKDGTVKDISKVDNALIHQHLGITIKKYYFCHFRV